MGTPNKGPVTALDYGNYATFEPRFARAKGKGAAPEVMRFRETILQSAIKRYLRSGTNLQGLLNSIGFHDIPGVELEVLGEKALPQGHVDILLKRRVPLGSDSKIPIEVKTKKALPKDLTQLCGYMSELQEECPVGILLAGDFHKKVVASAKNCNVRLVRYTLAGNLEDPSTLDELGQALAFEPSAA